MKFRLKSASLIMAFVIVSLAGALFVDQSKARVKTYKIGDRGPGGGWIFYDKGNSSDGWRYLEAAPEDQGDEVEWGCRGKAIPGAKGMAVGTGKSNTLAIVTNCGEANIAAKLAAAYRSGGKSDWFMPSRDELNLMYLNLYSAGVGNFTDGTYWSSSEFYAYISWNQYFQIGYKYYSMKSNSYRVRAIRAF